MPSVSLPGATAYWGSIGYSVGSLLGTLTAAPEWRHLLFVGDGSFQLTAQEVSTMLRHDYKPVIFLINNRGYTIERCWLGKTSRFNDVANWARPGGVFAFPVGAPQPVTSGWYWALLGFDLAMRVRNAVWRPPFVMYYRTCPLHEVRSDLTASGFTVTTFPLTALGRREDGSPRYRLVLARSQHALTAG